MNTKKAVSITAAALLLLNGTAATAAEKYAAQKADSPATMDMRGMDMQHSGSMKGMAGMMGMMEGCGRMMKGGMSGHMLPQLPPGNDKLQLQMHAEMMQKMGEVLTKYAGQIKDDGK